MFDPNLDPFHDLEVAKHNITELIRGMNHQSELFKEFQQQHQAVMKATRDLQLRVSVLETENRTLKTQLTPIIIKP